MRGTIITPLCALAHLSPQTYKADITLQNEEISVYRSQILSDILSEVLSLLAQ